jgi:hypothetical protein
MVYSFPDKQGKMGLEEHAEIYYSARELMT